MIWQHHTERPRLLAGDSEMLGPVVAGSQVIFCGGYGWNNGGQITALDRSNGEQRWTHHAGWCRDRPLVTSTEAIGWGRLDANQVRMKAIDLDSGDLFWQRDLPREQQVAGLHQGAVYVRTQDAVLAIAARTGAVTRHSIDACDEPSAQAWIVLEATRVLAGCRNGLYTLDGQKLVTLQAELRPVVHTALSGDTLYLTETDRLLAFELTSGRLVWQRQFSKVLSSPLVDGNALYVHVSKPWALHRIDAQDGRDVWTNPVRSFHTPVRVDEALYTNDGASLIQLHPDSGESVRRWTAPAEISAPPAVAGGALFFGTLKGVLYSVREQALTPAAPSR